MGRRSLGAFVTKEEAQKAERDALQARDQGFDLPAKTLTLAQVAERFFRDIKGRLAPATYARYEEHWKHHVEPALGNVTLSKIRPAHIAELLSRLGSEPVVYVHRRKDAAGQSREKKRIGKRLGGTSLVRVHRFIHRMLRWAQRMSLVGRNVAAVVEAPRQTASKARALTADEAAKLLSLAQGRDYYRFLLVALETGMRRGELAGLQWDSVDLEQGWVIVRRAFGEDRRGGRFIKGTKAGRERVIPLAPAAQGVLREIHVEQAAQKLAAKHGTYEDRDFVFADKHGRPCDLNALSKAFAELARVAEITGVSLHSCRHFTATAAIVEGSDIRSVAAIMGHAQPSTTLNVYGHVVAGAKAATMEKVGEALSRAQARQAASQNRAGEPRALRPKHWTGCNQTATNPRSGQSSRRSKTREMPVK
jgi:integrase